MSSYVSGNLFTTELKKKSYESSSKAVFKVTGSTWEGIELQTSGT